jgi:hypothetical protein
MISDDRVLEILLPDTLNEFFIQNSKPYMTFKVEAGMKIQIVVFCLIMLGNLYAHTSSTSSWPRRLK